MDLGKQLVLLSYLSQVLSSQRKTPLSASNVRKRAIAEVSQIMKEILDLKYIISKEIAIQISFPKAVQSSAYSLTNNF